MTRWPLRPCSTVALIGVACFACGARTGLRDDDDATNDGAMAVRDGAVDAPAPGDGGLVMSSCRATGEPTVLHADPDFRPSPLGVGGGARARVDELATEGAVERGRAHGLFDGRGPSHCSFQSCYSPAMKPPAADERDHGAMCCRASGRRCLLGSRES